MKKIKYLFQYIIFLFFYTVANLLPINLVSYCGGFIFKVCGPFTKSHKIAISNYQKIFSHHKNNKIKSVIDKSWENLGKTITELLILKKLLNKKNAKIKIRGKDNLNQILKKNEKVIFFSIHQANWEILVPIINKLGFNVGAIYRHINNPYINNSILNIRKKTLKNKLSFFTPKGKESAREVINAIKKNNSLVLLVDQKDNAGVNVNFFNIKVKTQVGFLKIAKKHKIRLIPVQIVRKNNNNFLISFNKPINLFKNKISETAAMQSINNIIEKWIKSNPSQWLWQHNRFN